MFFLVHLPLVYSCFLVWRRSWDSRDIALFCRLLCRRAGLCLPHSDPWEGPVSGEYKIWSQIQKSRPFFLQFPKTSKTQNYKNQKVGSNCSIFFDIISKPCTIVHNVCIMYDDLTFKIKTDIIWKHCCRYLYQNQAGNFQSE